MTMQAKRTLPFLVVALCLALPVSAQIYQWKDSTGKTVISDKPPVGQVPVQKQVSPAQAAPGQPSLADRELEFRKRQKEAAENAEKAQKETAAAAEKDERCQNARRQLKTFESGVRIASRDDKGERYYLDGAQREQETSRIKSFIEAQCN
ncbi:hypothetical protein AGMMS50256_38220 [Betaproteobacteria bacterium]|nr:hypothetical protein AGMMS50256_38220 [Betaproteobacteria bacterium]